jgi:hypothetical protein
MAGKPVMASSSSRKMFLHMKQLKQQNCNMNMELLMLCLSERKNMKTFTPEVALPAKNPQIFGSIPEFRTTSSD